MRARHTTVFNFALVVLFVLTAGLSSVASGQTPARRQSPAPQRQGTTPASSGPRARLENEADASADVSITARVTAESLRFERVPNPRVEFTGRPRRETAWESERENLPQQVRPGETYRNIGITLRIRSVFADIDRIVAEALGEVPPSDDAPAAQPPAEPTTPPSKAPAADAAATRQRRAGPRRGKSN